jgi:hypothetical protein
MRRRISAVTLIACLMLLSANEAPAATLDYVFQTLDVPGAIGPPSTGGTYAQSTPKGNSER